MLARSDQRAKANVRTRRYRQRLKIGVRCVRIEVDDTIIGLLLDLSWLAISESEDGNAIAGAIANMLADAAKHVQPRIARDA